MPTIFFKKSTVFLQNCAEIRLRALDFGLFFPSLRRGNAGFHNSSHVGEGALAKLRKKKLAVQDNLKRPGAADPPRHLRPRDGRPHSPRVLVVARGVASPAAVLNLQNYGIRHDLL
eukprot:TRINITY_DN1591_c0_g1_i1.p1 TRINITY_DN1591_c0_g1~~TRINITY_DN1591_c0_g1_i1.p1  ORF type:complete len:116 (-),score=3.95 TRINITY_DN1591_c0_g1_i1:1-348(-)